jgi:hypothetical protein
MIIHTMKRCVLGCLLFASACLRKADGDAGDDGFDTARLHDACEAWCQVAVPCSENYALNWGFSTQAECEDGCIINVEHRADEYAECFDIVLDVRECAAALTCEEFKQYENWSFGDPTDFPVSCLEEQQEAQTDCNF